MATTYLYFSYPDRGNLGLPEMSTKKESRLVHIFVQCNAGVVVAAPTNAYAMKNSRNPAGAGLDCSFFAYTMFSPMTEPLYLTPPRPGAAGLW